MGDLAQSEGETSSSTRRPSLTPSLLARRGMSMPALPNMVRPSSMRRPKPTPLQRSSIDQGVSSDPSQRSVHFDQLPTFERVLGSPMTVGARSTSNLLPGSIHHGRRLPTLFGRQTQYRPLWLLGLANAGSCVFGSGEVVLQRAIWPAKAYQGLSDDGPTAIPAGAPGHGAAFGGAREGIIGGTILMVVGVSATLTASAFFVRDGRALNRRQNPAAPNYRRTMTYFYCHLGGIALLVGHRFAIEAFRIYLDPRYQWVASVPGAVGQAVFAVTQAQSFSSCELYNGRMPLRHRGEISAAARAGVSIWVLVAAIVGTPNFSAYWRETARLFAQTSTAVAYSLPLTTARMAARPAESPRIEYGGMRFRGDWTAMQIFVVYALSRMVSMLGAYWFEHSRWPAVGNMTQPAFANGTMPPDNANITTWRHLPPPLPSHKPSWDDASCALSLLIGATCLGYYAFFQFRKDVGGSTGRRNAFFCLAAASLSLGQVYRVMTENAKAHANFERVWQAMPIGVVANALAFVIIPELFSRSEITRGNAEVPHRYQVTEGCRAVGNLSLTLWAAMSGILGFPPLARMGMNWLGSIFTLMGMSLPNAETRRGQTGSAETPQIEPDSWLGPR